MYLATNLAIFRSGDFWQRLEQIRSLGFQAVELAFIAQDPYGLWCGTVGEKQIRKIREALRPFRGVGIHAGFQELSLLSAHPGVRRLALEEVFLNLKLARELGAETVTIHPGTEGEIFTAGEIEVLMRDVLTAVDRQAAETGVWACWETGTGDFVPLEKFGCISELGLQKTGICLDVGHLVRVWRSIDPHSRIRTFREFIERFGPWIRTVHIHDWQDRPHGKHTWNDHHMVGRGEIDWREVFSSLVKIGFEGLLTLEYHPDAFSDEAELRENCAMIRLLVKEAGGEIV